jgi:hypothetical protein
VYARWYSYCLQCYVSIYGLIHHPNPPPPSHQNPRPPPHPSVFPVELFLVNKKFQTTNVYSINQCPSHWAPALVAKCQCRWLANPFRTLTPNIDRAHGKPIHTMGKCEWLSTTCINPRISNGKAVPQITTRVYADVTHQYSTRHSCRICPLLVHSRTKFTCSSTIQQTIAPAVGGGCCCVAIIVIVIDSPQQLVIGPLAINPGCSGPLGKLHHLKEQRGQRGRSGMQWHRRHGIVYIYVPR